MSGGLLLAAYLAFMLVCMFFGLWMAVSLGFVGVIGVWIFNPAAFSVNALGPIIYNSIGSFELTAVPLFLLMGELILKSGISQRFYKGATVLTRKLPGGLLQTNVFTCAFFSAICGSSVATAAAVASVAYPEQEHRGYDKKMVVGSLAAGGTLGILIPPSVIMIIYGSICGESVIKLFTAGILPGILAIIIFMIFVAVRTKITPSLAPVETETSTAREKLDAFISMCPFFITIGIVLGGIYLGWTTPTEAAAFGVMVAVGISLIFRTFSWKNVYECLRGTVMTSSMVLFILVGAKFLSFLLVYSGLNRQITAFAKSLGLEVFGFIMFTVVLYLIIGSFMDAISSMFLTLPLLLPILVDLQIDLIWFAVIMTVLLEIGHLTPPLGMNVFVLHSVTNRPIEEVMMGTIPYWFLLLLVTFIVIFVPEIATWLPGLL